MTGDQSDPARPGNVNLEKTLKGSPGPVGAEWLEDRFLDTPQAHKLVRFARSKAPVVVRPRRSAFERPPLPPFPPPPPPRIFGGRDYTRTAVEEAQKVARAELKADNLHIENEHLVASKQDTVDRLTHAMKAQKDALDDNVNGLSKHGKTTKIHGKTIAKLDKATTKHDLLHAKSQRYRDTVVGSLRYKNDQLI